MRGDPGPRGGALPARSAVAGRATVVDAPGFGATCLPRRPHTRRDEAAPHPPRVPGGRSRRVRRRRPARDPIRGRPPSAGIPFGLRDYQAWRGRRLPRGPGPRWAAPASSSFLAGRGRPSLEWGSCGLVGAKTLVLTTNTVAVRQWRDELLDKTTLTEDEVGEYTGDVKDLKPRHRQHLPDADVAPLEGRTTSSTSRCSGTELGPGGLRRGAPPPRAHLPCHRGAAGAPAARAHRDPRARGQQGRRGLLPDRAQALRRAVEGARGAGIHRGGALRRGPRSVLRRPARAHLRRRPSRQQFRLASENPAKLPILKDLVQQHQGERVLVIGQYLDQLKRLAKALDAPLLTGRTPNAERERLYGAFREGEIDLLILSKVGNFAVDLPDASVAIQVSGTFGSRQEEAQRLGRVLRPKSDGSGAVFYSVVTLGSRDQEFSREAPAVPDGAGLLVRNRPRRERGQLQGRTWRRTRRVRRDEPAFPRATQSDSAISCSQGRRRVRKRTARSQRRRARRRPPIASGAHPGRPLGRSAPQAPQESPSSVEPFRFWRGSDGRPSSR